MPRTVAHRRSGFAVVIVLALLSVTLALSYSMMRVQSTTNQIQQNMSRQSDARQAALSGLSAGIRQMYDTDWQGVDSSLSMNLGNHQSYEVRYATGDPRLMPEDPDYSEFPFRVTVVSTGYAFDPVDPSIRSQYTVRAVMQLIRKKFQASPAAWQAAQGHTVYAWGTGDSRIEAPCQIRGKTFVNGNLRVCEDWEQTSRPFYGLIDEVAIYDRPLTLLEILYMNLWGNGSNTATSSGMNLYGLRHWWRFNETDAMATIASSSSGGRNGLYRGGVVPGISIGGGNHAVFTDGVTGRVELGNLDLPPGQDFSIAAWVAPAGSQGENADSRIISKALSTDNHDHLWMVGLDRQGWSTRPRVRVKTNNDFIDHSSSGVSLNLSNWNLIVITRDHSAKSVRIYVGGSLVETRQLKGPVQRDSSIMAWIGDNPPGSARSRYLEDLTRLATSENGADYRPLSGEVIISNDRTPLSTYLTLLRQLECTVSHQATSATGLSSSTLGGSTYRLYPGGKAYEIPDVEATLGHRALGPDPDENPLGIYRCNRTVQLKDQVTLSGTLLASTSGSDIVLDGRNLNLQGLDLPGLTGDSTVYQFPVLIAADDITATDKVEAEIEGAIATGDSFNLHPTSPQAYLRIAGMVFTKDFDLQARKNWENLAQYSGYYLSNFINNVGRWNHSANFAQWLDETTSGKFENALRIAAPQRPTSFQWLDLTQPIYQPGQDDAGLMWDLVRWIDDGGT